MTKEYFEEHVNFAVEVEYETGGRNWQVVKGVKELHKVCEFIKDILSDIDYCTDQDDPFCRKVLNLAWLNWHSNYEWCKQHIEGCHCLDDVINFILDNNLAA